MLYSDKRFDISDQILRTISRSNNRRKLDSRKDKKEIEDESLIDESINEVDSDIVNKENENIKKNKPINESKQKPTVKELLEKRKRKNSDKRKVKD